MKRLGLQLIVVQGRSGDGDVDLALDDGALQLRIVHRRKRELDIGIGGAKGFNDVGKTP